MSNSENTSLIKVNIGLEHVNKQIAVTNKILQNLQVNLNQMAVSPDEPNQNLTNAPQNQTPKKSDKWFTIEDMKRLPIKEQLKILERFHNQKKE